MNKKFYITGMTCSACSAFIDRTINKMNGVENCVVSLVTNTMIVEFDENICSVEQIIQKVIEIGYGASLTKKEEKGKEVNYKKIKLIISIIILVVLMYVSMGHMFGLPIPEVLHHPNADRLYSSFWLGLIQLILVVPIIGLNFGYFTRGFKHLIKKNPNMDSLIAIGALASLIYGIVTIGESLYGWINNDLSLVSKTYEQYYFESAGSILTFVSVGKYFESLSKKKTTDAIEKLIDLTPQEVFVKKGEEFKIVPIEFVKENDLVMIKPGMQVPLDGEIIEGETSINSASLTGESIPLYKKVKDSVLAGTLNISGTIIIKVVHGYEDSSISKIIKLVEEASNSKMPISRIVDKVARIFVPVVIGIAALTAIIWSFIDTSKIFEHAISVLVISCPCALGLATPLGIMVASGTAANHGILIRNSSCLEILKDVKTVVFDKTGTLTKGLMSVKEIKTINTSYQELIDLVYSIEKNSNHPLASSIVDKVQEEVKKVFEFDTIIEKPGLGMIANLKDDTYLVGNPKLLREYGVQVPEDNLEFTKIMLAKNDELLGIITFEDEIKEQSASLINTLKNMKIKTVLLSGDNKKVALNLANKLGIDECFAEAMPEDKKNIVEALKQNGKVLMVGDGINDAVALTAADIGMAIGDGTDIAIDSADIVIIGQDLLHIVEAINLSKKTIEIIKMNLFWAFFYNAICIPVAAGILVPLGIVITPMVGSLMMSLSSVCVVLNSLRLKKIKNVERKEEKIMKKTLKVEGMMCKHCQKHVEDALVKVEGVTGVVVDLASKTATVELAKEVSNEQLVQAVTDAGYDVVSVE
ncbi:MAG: cadmium-translocating P-type ATPase [Bacilli bacterium]|nr:cadmium-translocating P-type ATPase [Bacilli bacterium]